MRYSFSPGALSSGALAVIGGGTTLVTTNADAWGWAAIAVGILVWVWSFSVHGRQWWKRWTAPLPRIDVRLIIGRPRQGLIQPSFEIINNDERIFKVISFRMDSPDGAGQIIPLMTDKMLIPKGTILLNSLPILREETRNITILLNIEGAEDKSNSIYFYAFILPRKYKRSERFYPVGMGIRKDAAFDAGSGAQEALARDKGQLAFVLHRLRANGEINRGEIRTEDKVLTFDPAEGFVQFHVRIGDKIEAVWVDLPSGDWVATGITASWDVASGNLELMVGDRRAVEKSVIQIGETASDG